MSLSPNVPHEAWNPEPQPGLVVDNVTVAYANGNVALRDASFSLGAGTIAGLVGVNGSGKSTLFKAIMGFVTPLSGSVHIAGLTVREALKRNMVAYVPQAEEVDWNFPVLVEDVVMMGRQGRMGFFRIPSARDRQLVTEALDRVGMTEFRKRQIGELSGGQKKRVFLARALAQEGDDGVLGLDVDPSEGLVEQDDAGILREGAGEEDALALAAGEFADLALAVFGHADAVERGGDGGVVGRAGHAQPVHVAVATHHHHVLDEDGEIPVDLLALRHVGHDVLPQRLGDRHAEHGDVAVSQPDEAHDGLEQGGFA